jgi:O-antigen/teichoic acid export membrane protein
VVFRENVKSNLFTRVMIFGMAFVSSILTARALGPEQKGVLSFAWTGFTLIASFGHLGLNNVIIYFHTRRHQPYPDIIQTNGSILFVMALGYGGALYGLKTAGVIPSVYTWGFLLLGAIFVGMHFQMVLFRAFYIAGQDLVRMNRYVLAAEVLGLLLIAGLFVTEDLTPSTWVAAMCLVILTQLILFVLNNPPAGIKLKFSVDLRLLKEELGYGVHALLTGLFLFLIFRSDQFFIYYFLGDGPLGVYSVAVAIAGCFLFVPQSIATALAGKLYAHDDGDLEKYRFFFRTLKVSSGICLLMALVGVGVSHWMIALYGTAFSPGLQALRILIISTIFLSFSQLGNVLFFTEGKIRLCMILSGIACFSNLALNVLLIPSWGIEGAAIASLISYAILGGTSWTFMLKCSQLTLKKAILADSGLWAELNAFLRMLR